MAEQFTLPGGIFTGTPGGFQDVSDLLPVGYTLVEVDSMIITCQRAPIGFLQIYDTLDPPTATGVSGWWPIVNNQQIVNFQALGQPEAPFVGPIYTYAWSLVADDFVNVLDAMPSAELDVFFVVRANPPA
jgi:hypothetical protein